MAGRGRRKNDVKRPALMSAVGDSSFLTMYHRCSVAESGDRQRRSGLIRVELLVELVDLIAKLRFGGPHVGALFKQRLE